MKKNFNSVWNGNKRIFIVLFAVILVISALPISIYADVPTENDAKNVMSTVSESGYGKYKERIKDYKNA